MPPVAPYKDIIRVVPQHLRPMIRAGKVQAAAKRL